MKRLYLIPCLLLLCAALQLAAKNKPAIVEQLDSRAVQLTDFHKPNAGTTNAPASAAGVLYTADLAAPYKAGRPLDFAITLRNSGATPIESILLRVMFNNSDELTRELRDLDIAVGDNVRIILPELWAPPRAGEYYPVECSIEKLNGALGTYTPLQHEVFAVLGVSAPNHVLIEEFTGTWCGWCTDGAWVLNNLLKENPDANAASLHVGVPGFPDPMEIPAGFELSETYHAAYPRAMFNRLRLHGVTIPVTRTVWTESYAAAYNRPTALSVNVHSSLDAGTRKLNIESSVEFVDFIGRADLRINVYILEDGVTGPPEEGYAQNNFLTGREGYEHSPYYNQPAVLPDFIHNHVVRASLTGAWGDKLEGAFEPGEILTTAHSYDIPEGYNIDNMSVIAFVSHFDSEVSYRPVLNSGHSAIQQNFYTDVDTPVESLETVGSPGPNPANDISYLRVHVHRQAALRADLYTMQGTKLLELKNVTAAPGVHSIAVATSAYSSGAYLLRVELAGHVYWRKLLVQH